MGTSQTGNGVRDASGRCPPADSQARPAHLSLRQWVDYGQRKLGWATQRALLVVFILLQCALFTGHLLYQRSYIEDQAARILRNTALLKAEQFEADINAMRYQMRVIGNAILLNHTIATANADPFLVQELKRDWLDGVIVFNASGDFVAQSAAFPLSEALSAATLAQHSFRGQPLFKYLRSEDVDEKLFYWQSTGADPHLGGFVIYRAIRDPLGRYLGGTVGYFNASTMATMFQKMENEGFYIGHEGAMTVLDRDNVMELARMGAGPVPGFPRHNPLLGQLLAYASDTAQVHHYVSPVDGVPRMGVFLNINEGKWVLGVGLAKRDILHGWYWQVCWTVLALMITALLHWMLLHYIHANFIQRERLALEARQDPLTGLANRRDFNERARSTCNLAQRYGYPVSVLTLDLDFFKQINDSYGHDGGDAVLRSVAQMLQEQLRAGDIAARFGGEEFVVAMPHAGLDAAAEVAERIRASFAQRAVAFGGQMISFTASFGVAQLSAVELEAHEGVHAALARADQALYRAKREGRNRVSVEPGAAEAWHAGVTPCH